EGRVVSARAPQLVHLRRAARECEQRLVQALASLQAEDPEYASLQTAGSVPLEVVRASLPEGAILLEYYRVGNRFYVCVLSRTTLEIVPLGLVAEVRRGIQLLRFQLSKFRLGAGYLRVFEAQLLDATRAHLYQFHKELIEPIESRISGAE